MTSNMGKDMMKPIMALALCGGLVLTLGGCKPRAEERPGGGPAGTTETPAPGKAATMDPTTVLVEVDGVKLTAGEVDAQIQRMVANNPEPVSPERLALLMPRLRQQATEQFVVRTLLKNAAARENIAVSDEDVQAAIADIRQRLPEQMTLEQALEKEGLTEAQFRTNLIDELKVKKLVERHVSTNLVASAEEIAAFYEEQKDRFGQPESVEARHILVKVDETDTDTVRAEKKARAEDLRKQLLDGADFAKLAREQSDCPSKERGGNLGVFGRGQMVKEFEEAAFSQPTNAIGPVVETKFGYHIIQVTSHTPPTSPSLEEMQERIGDYLKQRKQLEALETYLGELRSKAKIVRPDQPADTP